MERGRKGVKKGWEVVGRGIERGGRGKVFLKQFTDTIPFCQQTTQRAIQSETFPET